MISDDYIKRMREDFKKLNQEILNAVNIIIYRHQSPDFDALGAQMGLYQWLVDNFPNKKVYYVGDTHPDYMPDLFPNPMELSDDVYNDSHIGIVVDTSNRSRIAQSKLSHASRVIKIDHHPIPNDENEQFGDISLVYEKRPAASEIIALFLLTRKKKYKISEKTASYLYCGIVGDTGKFSYQDTDGATLRIAADLIDRGANPNKICNEMFQDSQQKIEILKYCLNNYKKTEKGCFYYILDKDIMEKLKMTVDNGNAYINNFRDMKGCKVACSITWDSSHNDYRVSLRSASLNVSSISVKYNGGGHDYACGCHIKSLDLLEQFLHDVDLLIDENLKSNN